MKTKIRQFLTLSILGIVLGGVIIFLHNNPSTSHLFKSMKSSAIGGTGGGGGTVTLETDSDGKWTRSDTWTGGDKPGDKVDGNEIVYIDHSCTLDDDIEISGQLIITSNGSLTSHSKKIKLKDGGSIVAAGEIYVKEFDIEGGSFTSSSSVYTKEDFKVDGDATISFTGFVYVKKDLEIEDGASVTFGDSVYVKEDVKIEASTVNFGNGLHAKKKISVKDGSTVTFDGNIYVKEGVDKIQDSEVTISGSFFSKDNFKMDNAILNINGSLEVGGDLVVNDEDSEINIAGWLYVKDDFDNDGEVNIETSTEKTGSLYYGEMKGEEILTFERHIQKDGWHYLSSPIEDAKTNVLWGGAVYSYDESSGEWAGHKANEVLTPGMGYDVYFKNEHKTITFKGVPNSGTFSHTLTYTSGTGEGYNLVGNPYSCSIDWESSSGWTKNNIASTIYVWDDEQQNIASYTTGGACTNGGSAVIPPTMAFFVKVSSAGNGTLSMTEKVRVADVENFRKRKVTPQNLLSLKIKGAGYSDETIVGFENDAKDELDEFDAKKLYSYNVQVPQIYTKIGDDLPLAVNTLANLDVNVSIPVYFNAKIAGDYTIDFNLINFELPVNIYLEDRNTGKMTDLNAESYTFNTEQTEDDSRFILHFIPLNDISQGDDVSDTSGLSAMEELNEERFNIYSTGRTIYIKANEILREGQVKIFDLSGKEIRSDELDNNTTNSFYMGTGIAAGYYIVSIFEKGNILKSRKIFVR